MTTSDCDGLSRSCTAVGNFRHEPIHRWLAFDDSWSPGDVRRVFRRVEVRPGDVVWDPFCGSGTTAVVAATAGLRCVASDISAMNVLVTRVKATLPLPAEIARTRRTIAQLSDAEIGSRHSWKSLLNTPRSTPLRFAMIAGMVRAGWLEGQQFVPGVFRRELLQLCEEMEADVRSVRRGLARTTVVRCTIKNARARAGRLERRVMVTSAPFFGSDVPPRLGTLLRAAGCSLVHLRSMRRLIEPSGYRAVLLDIARAAARSRCEIVAIEIGADSLSSNTRGNFWADELCGALTQRGYTVAVEPFSPLPCASVLCIGTANARRR